MGEITRESIIEAAKEAYRKAGRTISRADFERLAGVSDHYIYKLFPDGGWSEVLRLADLPVHPKYHPRMSDDDLLTEYHKVASSLGSIPTWARFVAKSGISANVISDRFGGLEGTLQRYKAWLEEHHPSSPLLSIVAARCGRKGSTSVARPVDGARSASQAAQWRKGGGLEYGAPIDFRGLRHAPTNEQGVVYLFGMVSRELDILVEAIHVAYPDCEGKRCIDRRLNRWQTVRIEFEYTSSRFDHDPAGCDLIVCWEHDWSDCPVEVIELREVIKQLPS